MFIPGKIIAIFTFPGIIVHEFAHMIFCKIRKVAVFEVCYFQFDNPQGFVKHERTDNFTTTFLISMGPFLVNTLLCLLICIPAYLPVKFFEIDHLFSYFLVWLGVSIGMHAIPSDEDATNIFEQAKVSVKHFNILAIVSFPIIGLIYLFNALRMIWADLFYGIIIGLGIPSLLFG
ncbi:MAG: metalloprotease family protein [Paludibacter sp.]|nr:metalloprotease family protein [Paludibacter sp.]